MLTITTGHDDPLSQRLRVRIAGQLPAGQPTKTLTVLLLTEHTLHPLALHPRPPADLIFQWPVGALWIDGTNLNCYSVACLWDCTPQPHRHSGHYLAFMRGEPAEYVFYLKSMDVSALADLVSQLPQKIGAELERRRTLGSQPQSIVTRDFNPPDTMRRKIRL